MSKNKWYRQQQAAKQGGVIPNTAIATEADREEEVTPIAPDGALVDTSAVPQQPDADGIMVGQVWDGVIVPNRAINILSLTPGAVLKPLRVEAKFNDGTGHWCCAFVGESITKIRADAEMLKTGKVRDV